MLEKIQLGSIVNIRTGKLDANASDVEGKYPFFTCATEPLKINTFAYDTECVLVAGNGDLNVKYYNGKFNAYQRTYIIESRDISKYKTKYVFWFLNSYIDHLRKQSAGGVIKFIKLNNLTDAMIPNISIFEQEDVITKLETLKRLICNERNMLSSYDELIKSRFISQEEYLCY